MNLSKVLLRIFSLTLASEHGRHADRRDKDYDLREEKRPLNGQRSHENGPPRDTKAAAPTGPKPSQSTRVNLDPDWDGREEVEEIPEEGEPMDAENDDDAAMMAMMGFGGFGSTKVTKADNILPRSIS